MFEAKAKLFTKQCETKTQKLNRYFMEGQNKDGVWKNVEKLVEFIWFWFSFHFACRDREGWWELARQHLKQKLMTLEPVT